MNNRDNLLGVLQTIYRWRKTIRNTCLLALVGSLGISLLLKNYYSATTIFYPASTQLSSPELIYGSAGQVLDIYGGSRELDRQAEIANSDELVDFMISKFKLYEHYDMDSTSAKSREKVREMFRGFYTVEKNKNDALEITVEDTAPQMAADMANASREHISQIELRLRKESQGRLLMAFENSIKAKQAELVVLADSLRRLQKKYNIYDTEVSAEWLSESAANTEAAITKYKAALEVLENNPFVPRDTVEFIKANLLAAQREKARLRGSGGGDLNIQHFTEGQPLVYVLKDLHFQARKQMSYDLERYYQIKSAWQSEVPAVHIIEKARVPEVKSRPKRSVIVVASVLAAFLFTLLAALMADAYREVDWRKIRE